MHDIMTTTATNHQPGRLTLCLAPAVDDGAVTVEALPDPANTVVGSSPPVKVLDPDTTTNSDGFSKLNV